MQYMRTDDWRSALRTFEKNAANVQCVSVHAYSAAMAMCENAGQWEETVRLLRDMEARSIEPNAFAYAAAIRACEANGQVGFHVYQPLNYPDRQENF